MWSTEILSRRLPISVREPERVALKELRAHQTAGNIGALAMPTIHDDSLIECTRFSALLNS